MVVTVETLTSLIGQYLPEPHAGLLSGIAFGTKAAMSRELLEALTRTGTLHVVALSGMNISIVAGIVSLTLLRFISRRIASLLTVLIIIGFVGFVGPSPSVIRAAIMGSVALIAVVFGRSNWPLFAWVLAVVAMLLVGPGWITDISFQLSVLATLGIILFGTSGKVEFGKGELFFGDARNLGATPSRFSPSLNERSFSEDSEKNRQSRRTFSAPQNTHPCPSTGFFKLFVFIRDFPFAKNSFAFIADDLRVTLAAQVFTIPLILFHFHRISLISPLSNVLIGWTVGLLTILGWSVGFFGLLFDPVGQLTAWVAWVPLQYVIWVVTTTSAFPFASLSF